MVTPRLSAPTRRAAADSLLDMSEEVRHALDDGRAVVALESSVIAHGLPYPGNVETVAAVLDAVREAGAVPAVTAVAGGRLLVGVDDAGLERLATADDVAKVGNRDVGVVLARGGLGATTVASALAIADRAGIRVLAAGGIGGVHWGATASFDVSGDLIQLTRSRTAVVCAGAKSILDIGATLEYLETHGVPVIGYRCARFPAYYCRTTRYRVPQRMDRMEEIAAAMDLHQEAGMGGGVLVAAPIDERYAIDPEEMDLAIAAARAAADAADVRGAALTPFLMKHISSVTEGRSAAANRAVLVGSAALAGELAASCVGSHDR